MYIYKEEIAEETQEHREYFMAYNARAELVDSMGIPQTSSNIEPVLVDDTEDKLHFLDLEENFHCVYSFFKLWTYTSAAGMWKRLGQGR